MSLEDRLYPLLALYERLPRGIKAAVGSGYRRLPVRWRLGARYPEFQALAEGGERWTKAECEEYQRAQLREVLVHARRTCPYYRERFDRAGFDPGRMRSLGDMEGCPTIDKAEVQRHGAGMVSEAWPAATRLYITTGGSTGVPVGFNLQRGVSRPKEQAFLEAMWRRAGYEDGMRLAVIRGHVTSDRSGGRITSHDATRDWLMLSSYHLTEARWPEYLEAMEKFRPDIVHAYPSAALQLAEHLEKAGQAWRLPLRCVLCGSERLTLPQKRLLERVFRARVYRWYGHSERVVLAGEGRESEWFYFWPQYGHVEFGPPDDEGLREVIGTSFHNMAMPLIRYRTGDRVRLAETGPGVPETGETREGGPGAGGGRVEFPWPAAVEVAGRDQEYLVSGTGRRISLTAFNMHDAIFDGLYAVQFYQEEPGVAEMRYVAGPAFHDSRLEAISSGVRRKLGEDFRVTLRRVTETEKTSRGKHRWLVSRLLDAGDSVRD